MRKAIFRISISLLVFSGLFACSATPPPPEIPRCGEAIREDRVVVVDATHLDAMTDVGTAVQYAVDEVGEFELLTPIHFRSSSWPYQGRAPSWLYAKRNTAEQGCDVMILIGSEMLRETPIENPRRHWYYLMGFRPESP